METVFLVTGQVHGPPHARPAHQRRLHVVGGRPLRERRAPRAQVPAVNAVIDGDEIVYRDYTDISIAVATPKGLVVPVLRNADELSFADVEKARPRARVSLGLARLVRSTVWQVHTSCLLACEDQHLCMVSRLALRVHDPGRGGRWVRVHGADSRLMRRQWYCSKGQL